MVSKFGSGIGGDWLLAIGYWLLDIDRIAAEGQIANSVRRRRTNSGFSLLELLVSVGIFVVITTAVVFNFRAGERSDELRLAAQSLASAIRGLQTMAQTGRQVKMCPADCQTDSLTAVPIQSSKPNLACTTHDDCAPCQCLSRVPAGYGMRVAGNTFTFFADGDGDKDYDNGEELSDPAFTLPRQVVVDSITPSRSPSENALEIVFTPPEPTTWINACDPKTSPSPCPDEAAIALKHTQTNQTRTVTIKRLSGGIEVERD